MLHKNGKSCIEQFIRQCNVILSVGQVDTKERVLNVRSLIGRGKINIIGGVQPKVSNTSDNVLHV